MQLNLLNITDAPFDYKDKSVLIPLSEGINSAAVVCILGEHHPEELKPERLYLFDIHLIEHSPDSLQFAFDVINYARKKFKWVSADIVQDSMNKWCVDNQMIPHPSRSPCSRELKMLRLDAFAEKHQIDYRLVGYVRHEQRRLIRAKKYVDATFQYPIQRLTDEDCFSIVKRAIGWYPAIYDIRESGKRIFRHNNCLPCKNMTAKQLRQVGTHFAGFAEMAEETAARVPEGYWGRDDVPDIFKCDVCDRAS